VRGPPQHPQYYGQLERQNRDHRVWLTGLDALEIQQPPAAAMRTALNRLSARPTLGWCTAEQAWEKRAMIAVGRHELRRDVDALAAGLASNGVELLRARRIAIESALEERGLLNKADQTTNDRMKRFDGHSRDALAGTAIGGPYASIPFRRTIMNGSMPLTPTSRSTAARSGLQLVGAAPVLARRRSAAARPYLLVTFLVLLQACSRGGGRAADKPPSGVPDDSRAAGDQPPVAPDGESAQVPSDAQVSGTGLKPAGTGVRPAVVSRLYAAEERDARFAEEREALFTQVEAGIQKTISPKIKVSSTCKTTVCQIDINIDMANPPADYLGRMQSIPWGDSLQVSPLSPTSLRIYALMNGPMMSIKTHVDMLRLAQVVP
jgi:hypothetical protein